LQSLNRSLHTLERAVAAAGGRVSRTRSQAHDGAVKSELTHCRESKIKTVGHGDFQSPLAVCAYFQPLRRRYRWRPNAINGSVSVPPCEVISSLSFELSPQCGLYAS
jgi:hypothetical protein